MAQSNWFQSLRVNVTLEFTQHGIPSVWYRLSVTIIGSPNIKKHFDLNLTQFSTIKMRLNLEPMQSYAHIWPIFNLSFTQI